MTPDLKAHSSEAHAAPLPPLLLITYVYPPDNEIGAWRPYRFRKYLSRLGHRVEVVSSSRDESHGIDASGIYRVPGEFPGIGPRSPKKYLDLVLRKFVYDSGSVWVPPAVKAASAVARRLPGAVLLSTSPPILTHITAYWLKRRLNLPWIADFRDPMRDNPSRKLHWSRHLDPYFERAFMQHADIIIANTDRVLSTWKMRYPEFAGKMRMLANGFDPEDFQDVAPPPIRDFALLTHVGTLYASRNPLYMLRAAQRQISRGRLDPKRFRIRFYGHMLESIRLDQQTFQPLVESGCLSFDLKHRDKEESEQLMRESDSLLLLDYMEAGQLQVPAKLYFYIRTGRPVVACTLSGSPAEGILARSGIPSICLHPDDSEEKLDAGILESATFSGSSYTPSKWFLDQFDAARHADSLSEWIGELRQSPHRATQQVSTGG